MAASAATVLAVLVLASVIGLRHRNSPSTDPKLFYPSDAAFGIAVPYAGDEPWSFGAVPLCLTEAGSAMITGVRPVGGDGQVEPLAVATRPMRRSGLGDAQESLASFGFPASAEVSTLCSSGAYAELGTTFRRSGSDNASFTSLTVSYTSGGKPHTLSIPWRLKLCGPGNTTNEKCGTVDTP